MVRTTIRYTLGNNNTIIRYYLMSVYTTKDI